MLFQIGYITFALFVAFYGAWQFGYTEQRVWIACSLVGLFPLLQLILGFDSAIPAHHKIRKPLTTFVVLAAICALLLTASPQHPSLLLALPALGGFLLNTYWASRT